MSVMHGFFSTAKILGISRLHTNENMSFPYEQRQSAVGLLDMTAKDD
jgi:hypothetical protein